MSVKVGLLETRKSRGAVDWGALIAGFEQVALEVGEPHK